MSVSIIQYAVIASHRVDMHACVTIMVVYVIAVNSYSCFALMCYYFICVRFMSYMTYYC